MGTASSERIGWIGLGRMGRPMALNLLKAGYSLVVHNRSQAPVETLVAVGAERAGSPREVAERCDVLCTSLPMPATVEEVLLGPEGAREGARAGQLWIDTSTVDPGTSRRVAAAVAPLGVSFLDAPVSGGVAGAEAATLTFMVGGDDAALRRAQPILAVLGKTIFHVGPVGAGSICKLLNQMLAAINLAAVCEAAVLGAKLGIDPQTFYQVVSASSGNSRMLSWALPDSIFTGNFAPRFSINLMYKDISLAAQLGRESGVRLLLGAIAHQVFEEARAAGFGEQDIAALIRPLEQLCGIEVRVRTSEYM